MQIIKLILLLKSLFFSLKILPELSKVDFIKSEVKKINERRKLKSSPVSLWINIKVIWLNWFK